MPGKKVRRDIRLVATDELDLDDVIELTAELALEHVGVVDSTADNPFQSHWKDGSGQTEVIYCEDEEQDQSYFIFKGPSSLALARIFAIELDLWTATEVVTRLQKVRTSGAWVRNLRRAGVYTRSGLNNDLLTVIMKGLRHSLPEVRGAAIMAASSCGWKEFREELERICKLDDSEDLRGAAEAVLEHFTNDGWV